MFYDDAYFESGELSALPETYGYRLVGDRFDPEAKTEGEVITTGDNQFDKELFDAMQTNDMNVVMSFLKSSDPTLANQVQGDVLSEMQGRIDRRPTPSALTSPYQPFKDKVREELSKQYYDFDYQTQRRPTEVIETGDPGFDQGLKRAMDTNDMNVVVDYLNQSSRSQDYEIRGRAIEEMRNRVPGVRGQLPLAQTAGSGPQGLGQLLGAAPVAQQAQQPQQAMAAQPGSAPTNPLEWISALSRNLFGQNTGGQ